MVTKTIPAREETVSAGIECDACHAKTNESGHWEENGYTWKEVELKVSSVTQYPEDGNREDEELDLCPDCARMLIFEPLERLGIKPRVSESNW